MQQHPAAQRTEHAFQTHDQAGNGGVQVPLAQDLQGVGHAAGHDAAVENGQRILRELRCGRCLEQQSRSGAFHRHHQKLGKAQPHAVHLRGKVVHRNDLEAEQHRTAQQEPVAGLDAAKAVFHAQQIQAQHGYHHAHPQLRTALPAQKQAEHRHQHHVHGGQEASLCRGRIDGNADLLCSGSSKQKGAAHKACRQQLFLLGSSFGLCIGAAFAADGIKHHHRGDQHQYSQPAAPGQKAVGSHAGTGALGHKGCAPNKGAQQQKQRVLGLCVHQPMPSTFSRPYR